MNQAEKINFRQTRDFTEVFNVSIKFLRQNFKLFFKSIILVAGPFLLLSAIATGFYQSNAVGLTTIPRDGAPDFLSRFGWSFILLLVAGIFANLMLIGTSFAYMINYMEKGPGNFTVSDVGNTVFKNFGKLVLTLLGFFVILIPLILLFVLVALGFQGAGAGLIVLLVFLMFVGMAILLPPLMWQWGAMYLVVMQEKIGVFAAFSRTYRVMKGKFWWTWLLMFCALLAIGFASLIFTVPQLIYQMVLIFGANKSGGETSVVFIVVVAVCTFFNTVVHSVLYIISGFHYYSLAEEKDGIGLMERIDEIGNTPDTNVEQQY
jgi:hypothetical protein